MTQILSVSLSDEQYQFIKKELLSPSRILQDQINLKIAYKNGELLEDNASLNKKIQRITEHLNKMINFIDKKGLSNEFLEQKE